MIFVTVGIMSGFERLIKAMDVVAGEFSEEVIMQIGETPYEPKNAKFYRYILKEEIEAFYKESRLVVCHAGIGSILIAEKYNKDYILVPRMHKHGEAVDDHQLQIAKAMEKEGAIILYDLSNLKDILNNHISNHSVQYLNNGEMKLGEKLKIYLDNLYLGNTI